MHSEFLLTEDGGSGWVYVPIPVEHAPALMAFAARLVSGVFDDLPALVQPFADVSDEDEQAVAPPWTESDVRSFYRALDEPSRALLLALARREDPEIAIPAMELAKQLDMTAKGIGGLLGPMNRKARDEFGHEPLVESTIRRITKGDRRLLRRSLSMTSEHSALVRKANEPLRKRTRRPVRK
jgi:hypothetical protein